MKFTKLVAIVILLCSSFSLFSQDFTSKIRDNALVVFTLNGDNILKKVPENEINISQLFYEFKREMRTDNINTMSDFGFKFNSSMVYAMEVDTNMLFNLFFMPIKDLTKFESMISEFSRNKVTTQKDGYKSVSNKRNTEHVVWNSEFAVFAFGYYTGSLYQYRYYNSSDDYNYYEENKAIEKVLKEDTANKLTVKEKSDRVDEILKKGYKLSYYDLNEEIPGEASNNEKVIEEEVIEEVEVMEVDNIPPPPPPPSVMEISEDVVEEVAIEAPSSSRRSYRKNNYYNDLYRKKSEINDYRRRIRNKIRNRRNDIREEKKNKLVKQIFDTRFNTIFNKDIAKSINSVSSFTKSKDKKADGVLWMRNDYFQNGMKSMMTSIFGYGYYGRRYRGGLLSNSLYSFGEDISITKLYFEKKGVRFTKESDNNEKSKKATNAIFSTKQDSRFLKYINGDKFIGYISSTFSSEAAIRELPNLWTSTYTQFSPEYREEMEVLADIMEVFMDEKAIGEMATGNAMFVLKDMKEKEVSYTSYQYDENYKRTKVQKTRTELQPEFLFMLTTKNESLLTRIMKLGIKNEVISQKGTYYTTQTKKSKLPMDFFFAIKDGIVFVTTDEIEIQTIVAGGNYKGITKKHRKLIEKNSQVVYFDSKKLVSYLPNESVRRRNIEEFMYFKENGFEEVLMTTKNQKGNLFSEGFMHTPKGENNSAMYIFEFLNGMIEIGRR